MFRSGVTTLIISNEKMNVQSLEESGLFRILLDTLDASLLGNILTVKGKIRAGESTIRAG